MSSEDISKAIQSGNDDVVLKYLYSDTLPRVRNHIVKNSGSIEEAEDIFQDAVLNIYQMVYNNKIPHIANIGGFVFQSAKNAWINRAKRESRKTELSDNHEFIDYSEDSLSTIIDSEKHNALASVFEQVGKVCQELMTLAIYQKLSMEEIARKMGLSNANAAKSQNYRCKQRLAELVEQQPALKALLKQ